MKFTLLALAATCATSQAAVIINEFRTDQTGADDSEYFELAGTPSESLDGITYLVIGDGTGSSGVLEAVIDLSGMAIQSNGLFLAAEATFENAVGQFFEGITPDLVTTINFENSDNTTHLLVTGFTGANGDDLDTDDDGVLDLTPWTLVLNAISPLEEVNPPANTEYAYAASLGGEEVGPDGSFVPSHVFRDSSGNLNIGNFDIATGADTPGTGNIPEPTSSLLLLLGAIAACGKRRR
ncbi:PEP-CTERM sorting domain-containing protein [Verrucomicrobiaceae bacterium 227]